MSVHENIGPSDAIYIRVEKLAKNIDQLRSDLIHERSESDEIRLSVAAIDTRISEIESSRADEVHDMNQASLTADRWEVRGLVIALAGAALSLFGSLSGW